MPFATYSIKKDIFNDLEILKHKNFTKFINDIDSLNFKRSAILVDDEENTIFNIIKKKQDEISKGKISNIDMDEKKILLEDVFRILNDSTFCPLPVKYKKEIKLDFEKNNENEFNKEIVARYMDSSFETSIFKTVEKFKKEFLSKIQTFILSLFQNKKKNKGIDEIDSIYIFQKEFSSQLAPITMTTVVGRNNKRKTIKKIILNKNIDDCISHPYNPLILPKYYDENDKMFKSLYPENAKKIEYGTKLILNWLSKMPGEFRPKKCLVITDLPRELKNEIPENINSLRMKYKDFLIKDIKNIEFDIKFIRAGDLPRRQWWKHKRHFVFGSKLSLVVWSDLGVEIVNEKNNSELNPISKLVVQRKDSISQDFKEIYNFINPSKT